MLDGSITCVGFVNPKKRLPASVGVPLLMLFKQYPYFMQLHVKLVLMVGRYFILLA
jgi:hypothetical protein